MSRFEKIQPAADLAQQDGEIANHQRQAAIDLARAGGLLGPQDMAALFGIGLSGFYKNAKRGLYDVFKVNPPLGPRCYSGVLITRYLNGDPLYVPTFGRRRRA